MAETRHRPKLAAAAVPTTNRGAQPVGNVSPSNGKGENHPKRLTRNAR